MTLDLEMAIFLIGGFTLATIFFFCLLER